MSDIDTVGIAGSRVRSFIERVEQLEIAELSEGKKEVFAEAKAKAST